MGPEISNFLLLFNSHQNFTTNNQHFTYFSGELGGVKATELILTSSLPFSLHSCCCCCCVSTVNGGCFPHTGESALGESPSPSLWLLARAVPLTTSASRFSPQCDDWLWASPALCWTTVSDTEFVGCECLGAGGLPASKPLDKKRINEGLKKFILKKKNICVIIQTTYNPKKLTNIK